MDNNIDIIDPTNMQCFRKAVERGQRTFTLVEQDASSVKTIAHWIYLNIETCSEDKLRQALEDCILMRTFPTKKHAD